MSTHEEVEAVENMAAIMAELKTDARTLSHDLVEGIGALKDLGKLTIMVGLLAAASTLFLLNPEYYTGIFKYVTLVLLYCLGGLGTLQGYRVLRKYSRMKQKYSALIDISSKLGE